MREKSEAAGFFRMLSLTLQEHLEPTSTLYMNLSLSCDLPADNLFDDDALSCDLPADNFFDDKAGLSADTAQHQLRRTSKRSSTNNALAFDNHRAV